MTPTTSHTAALPVRGQVQLYVLHEPLALTADAAQRYTQWLSPDEHARWQRFRLEADRSRYLLARALVRSVLGTCVQQAPAALQFTRNRYGKPELLQPAATPEQTLKFNVSHTSGVLVLAVTLADEVGVDVECMTRNVEMLPLAERFFAASETAMLHATAAAALRDRFFRLWTLKEAYAKARGLGLQLGLDSFAFGFGQDDKPHLLTGTEAADWRFCSFIHDSVFMTAVAVNSQSAGCNLTVVDIGTL